MTSDVLPGDSFTVFATKIECCEHGFSGTSVLDSPRENSKIQGGKFREWIRRVVERNQTGNSCDVD
jgi:hypothetical protein